MEHGLAHCGRKLGIVFEKRVLRQVTEPKRKRLAGDCMRLKVEGHQDLLFLLNIIWVIRSRIVKFAVHTLRLKGMRYSYTDLVSTTDGKTPLGRSRRGGEFNIKMCLE